MKFKLSFIPMLYWVSSIAYAAEPVAHASPTGGLLKMMLGLILVLGVMAGVAYLVKRMLPGIGHHQSTIHVVGSASVGTRERVVVLEVNDRWLVVGVAPGHVSAIANLEKGVTTNGVKADGANIDATAQASPTEMLASSFGKILKNSASKFTEKTNG